MSLIEVNKLEKTYASDGLPTPVLHGVTFSIDQGEFVAVMGPSGSGKSTLLHILGFLDQPTGGEYRFEGKTAEEYSSAELAHVRNERMGFVFQAFNLLPRMTVLDNVKLPLLYSKVPVEEWDARARQAIESVGLGQRMFYDPRQLSGGEKQRVAIARALIMKPPVIFADEPTGNLDSASGRVVMEILARLHIENKHTIILITHETYTAEQAARIIRFRDGQIESDINFSKQQRSADSFMK